MQSPQESPSQPQASRRKLVRGVFAAPAILTVCSGSAMASQSSLQCLARHVTDGTNITPKVVGGLDAWARVQLHKATDGKCYVSGNQLQTTFATSNGWWPNPGTWLGINTGTGAVLAGTYSTPNTTMPPGATLMYSPKRYAVVRFDGAGNVTGVGTAGTGANVGKSCWNSFKPFV